MLLARYVVANMAVLMEGQFVRDKIQEDKSFLKKNDTCGFPAKHQCDLTICKNRRYIENATNARFNFIFHYSEVT